MILFNQSYAQQVSGEWFWQYPKPQGNRLNDVFVIDKLTAIAVGDLGTVIKTNDGGSSWSVQHYAAATECALTSVHFIDSLLGWATGGIPGHNRNILIKTTDGSEWVSVNVGMSIPLKSVYFINADTGFVVGEQGIVLSTFNKGETWENKNIDDYIGIDLDVYELSHITFVDDKNGWIVGKGYYGNCIFKTSDAGKTWEWKKNSISPIRYDGFNRADFVNEKSGYIVGDMGLFLKTTDGGESWSGKYIWEQFQDINYQFLNDICFTDSLNGWITGGLERGFVLKTNDGGENWYDQAFPENSEFCNAIEFSDNENAVIVGKAGAIFVTKNSGKNWTPVRSDIYQFNSVYFTSETEGWAIGEAGIILHTSDSGNTWKKLYQNDSLSLFSIIQSRNSLFVAGSFNSGYSVFNKKGVILNSSDGGSSWNLIIYDSTKGFSSIINSGDSLLIIAERGGKLFESKDNGSSWYFLSNAGFNLNSVQYVNQEFYASFYRGNYLITSTDKGKNWDIRNVDSSLSINDFFFLNRNKGWATGSHEFGKSIFYTTEHGNSWNVSNLDNDSEYPEYNSIYFADENIGWAAGCEGYAETFKASILLSTDGGVNWISQKAPSQESLSDIFFWNKKIGWAVGTGIFKTINGSGVIDEVIVNDSKEITSNFILYPNYPNPFNSTTKIRYYLKESGMISVKIYDVLGKLVKTLREDWDTPGLHEISFQAEHLSSGIYFCLVRSGSLLRSIKIILQK